MSVFQVRLDDREGSSFVKEVEVSSSSPFMTIGGISTYSLNISSFPIGILRHRSFSCRFAHILPSILGYSYSFILFHVIKIILVDILPSILAYSHSFILFRMIAIILVDNLPSVLAYSILFLMIKITLVDNLPSILVHIYPTW